jgi:protein-L-isoaspartate O-methyltransferase
MDYATYSPDDDKIRIYPAARLSPEDYATVKGAGFQWAPLQKCFYAVWSPGREDVAEALTGAELEDDDRSLSERAEERADRFEGYSENRARDYERAHEAVKALADGIPLGQPILVGHHSEKRARKDAERIENGMRRAVKMWKTSEYWKGRAAGAIHHAKYKERPDVRHRRIKGLESDARKWTKARDESEKARAMWTRPDVELTKARALALANVSGSYQLWSDIDKSEGTPAELEAFRARAVASFEATISRAARWLEHLAHRLDYERAMLGEAGGLAVVGDDKPVIEVGGRVLVGRGARAEWLAVLRVNRAHGKVNSVTTQAPAGVHWSKTWKYGVEEVQGYEPPTATDRHAAKAATKLPPLVNYRTEGARELTAAEYRRMPNDYKGTRVAAATDEHGAYRYRTCFKGGGTFTVVPVFLTDQPEKLPPPPKGDGDPEPPKLTRKRPEPPSHETTAAAAAADLDVYAAAMVRDLVPDARRAEAEALAETLRAGVKVVSAPHLFPTPVHVAERVAELLVLPVSPSDGAVTLLEPSAGTGRLIDAAAVRSDWRIEVVAVELNHGLAEGLRAKFTAPAVQVVCADFLEWAATPGRPTFDRIAMNPPFDNGADIRHIEAARKLLAPGGRLVAICANGPRQARAFAEVWDEREELESGTFEGTGARACILVFDCEEVAEVAPGFELTAPEV